MTLFFLVQGIGIGLAVAAPIGPVGLMCIRKALADGRLAAWAAGLGAALADTLFGAVVGLGLGEVADMLGQYRVGLGLVGGVFLLTMGTITWRKAARDLDPVGGPGPGMGRDFLSTFVITLTNPGTIFGVMGVFAGLGSQATPGDQADKILLVGGIFCGSSLWWGILTELTILARARFTADRMRKFNHLTGGMLFAFGIAALVSVVL